MPLVPAFAHVEICTASARFVRAIFAEEASARLMLEGMPSTVAQALHGERSAKSFTALFTARDGGVPMSSAAGCEPSPTCYRSHELLGRWGRCGEGLERREFSPGLPEVISIALKVNEDATLKPFF